MEYRSRRGEWHLSCLLQSLTQSEPVCQGLVMSTQMLPPHQCPGSTFDLKARTSFRFKKVHWLPHSQAQILASSEFCTIEHLAHSVSYIHLLFSFGAWGAVEQQTAERLHKDTEWTFNLGHRGTFDLWSSSTMTWVNHQWKHKHSSKNVGTLHNILTWCSDLQNTCKISV